MNYSFPENGSAGDLLVHFDFYLSEAAVEGLDDGAIGEAVAQEDRHALVAGGISSVENEPGTGGAGFISWGPFEAVCRGKAEALHGRHGAKVGLEFRGEKFQWTSLISFVDEDGVARDGVRFLPVPQGMGVVFEGWGLVENADHQEGDPKKDQACDDEVVAAQFHQGDFEECLWNRKPEVG